MTYRNRILSSIPRAELARMSESIERIDVTAGQILLEKARPIDFVYFPETAVISLRASADERRAPQVAMIGAEGIVGLSVFLGMPLPFERAVVLSGGTLMRMPAAAFAAAMGSCYTAQRLIRGFAQTQLEFIAQSSACIGKHMVTQRCARELLLLHDRTERDELAFTHLALAEMLGVRRPSVTVAAEQLRTAGAIEYRRKRIRIVNRTVLEALSCSCYATLRAAFDRLATDASRDTPSAGVATASVEDELPALNREAVTPAAVEEFIVNTNAVRQRAKAWSRGASASPLSLDECQHVIRDMGTVIRHLETAQEEMRVQIEALEEMRYNVELRAQAVRSLIDGLPEAFLETDAEGVITDLNAAAERMLGRPRHRAMGRPFVVMVESEDRASIRQFLTRVMRDPSTCRWNGRVVRADGEKTAVLSVDCSATQARCSAGRPGIRWLFRATP